MLQEGGTNAKDHIKRVLLKLFPVELQKKINRTGGYGKEKFHTCLEDYLKSEFDLHCHRFQVDVQTFLFDLIKDSCFSLALFKLH